MRPPGAHSVPIDGTVGVAALAAFPAAAAGTLAGVRTVVAFVLAHQPVPAGAPHAVLLRGLCPRGGGGVAGRGRGVPPTPPGGGEERVRPPPPHRPPLAGPRGFAVASAPPPPPEPSPPPGSPPAVP